MLVLFVKMLPLILLTLAGYALNRLKWIDMAFNRQLSLVISSDDFIGLHPVEPPEPSVAEQHRNDMPR